MLRYTTTHFFTLTNNAHCKWQRRLNQHGNWHLSYTPRSWGGCMKRVHACRWFYCKQTANMGVRRFSPWAALGDFSKMLLRGVRQPCQRLNYKEKHVRFLTCNSISLKFEHYKKYWKHKSVLKWGSQFCKHNLHCRTNAHMEYLDIVSNHLFALVTMDYSRWKFCARLLQHNDLINGKFSKFQKEMFVNLY